MNRRIFLICCLITFGYCFCIAQNLVNNPSFEDISNCPSDDNQLYLANGWTINVNTADLFNRCDSGIVSVPLNAFGFQQPATGDGYAGFYAYVYVTQGASNEFLGGQLMSPLAVGNKYYVSFKVSLADSQPELFCGVDKIGMLFTDSHWGNTVMLPPPFLNNYAHVYTNSIISDTSNWVTVQGNFVADSSYRYFMIGHFFDSLNINFQCLDSANVNYRHSYYYVDDICVSADSLECDLNTRASFDSPLAEIKIFPNPAYEKIYLKQENNKSIRYLLLALTGNKVKAIQLHKNGELDVSDVLPGMYILKIQFENRIYFIRQAIIH